MLRCDGSLKNYISVVIYSLFQKKIILKKDENQTTMDHLTSIVINK